MLSLASWSVLGPVMNLLKALLQLPVLLVVLPVGCPSWNDSSAAVVAGGDNTDKSLAVDGDPTS